MLQDSAPILHATFERWRRTCPKGMMFLTGLWYILLALAFIPNLVFKWFVIPCLEGFAWMIGWVSEPIANFFHGLGGAFKEGVLWCWEHLPLLRPLVLYFWGGIIWIAKSIAFLAKVLWQKLPWLAKIFKAVKSSLVRVSKGLDNVIDKLPAWACFFILLFLGLIFICSLDLLGSSFQLFGAKMLKPVFTFLQNPVVAFAAGMGATVVLQSSSTSTSIFVALVAGGVVPPSMALFLVAGANIGTTVTSGLVSLFSHGGDREAFGRAFGASTVHDFFNLIVTIVLLPLEYYYWMQDKLGPIQKAAYWAADNATSFIDIPDVTGWVTDPVVAFFVKVDKDKLALLSKGDTSVGSVIKDGIFLDSSMPDWFVGTLLLLLSLAAMAGSLFLVVKILQRLSKSWVPEVIKLIVGLPPYWSVPLTALVTAMVQSSSVVTSFFVPLVGEKIVTLKETFPPIAGANMGTTSTALATAFAGVAGGTENADLMLTMAMCHVMFNLGGIVLFSFMHAVPVTGLPWGRLSGLPVHWSGMMEEQVKRRPWVAFVYIVGGFIGTPMLVLVLNALI